MVRLSKTIGIVSKGLRSELEENATGQRWKILNIKEEEEQQWMDIQKYIKINEFVKIHFTKDSLVNFRGCVF